MKVISESDFTCREKYRSASLVPDAYKGYQDLYNDFLKSQDTLISDGLNLVLGHLNCGPGALSSQNELLQYLSSQEAKRAAG